MMKKCFLSVIAITFALAVIMVPGQGLAVPGATANGTASIDYNSLTFTFLGTLTFFDATGGNLQGSLSGVDVSMGGVGDPYHSDAIDGLPWGNTSVLPPAGVHNFSTAADTVEGRAYTNVTDPALAELFASANVALTNSSFPVPPSPPNPPPLELPFNGIGSVDLAQAVFMGEFTADVDGLLTVTANYSLLYNLGLLPGVGSGSFANAYVDAGLALYDFNGVDPFTGQSPLLASGFDLVSGMQPFLSGAINGPGTSKSDSASGLLTLTYPLIALDATNNPIVYDFEAFVTAKSSAAVPEPATLILLVSGMLGLAAFRKKFV